MRDSYLDALDHEVRAEFVRRLIASNPDLVSPDARGSTLPPALTPSALARDARAAHVEPVGSAGRTGAGDTFLVRFPWLCLAALILGATALLFVGFVVASLGGE